MKDLTNYFNKKDIIFKAIEKIDPKTIGSRKKVEIYCATGIDKNYYAIILHNSKSRFIRKTAEELMELLEKLSAYKEHNFKKKILLIGSPLCSKAKKLLVDNKWSVDIDFM